MNTNSWLKLGTAMAAAVIATVPLVAEAGKPGGTSTATRLKVNVLSTFHDAHDTNAFNFQTDLWPSPNYMCSPLLDGAPHVQNKAVMKGDDASPEPATIWTDLFWPSEISDPSTVYEDGSDLGTNALRAQFISSDRVLTIDTIGTQATGGSQPRAFTLDFSYTIDPKTYVVSDTTSFPLGARTITVPGLFEVLGSKSSLFKMANCTTAGCLEGTQNTYARYWFVDGEGQQWRLDWNFTRVLKIDDSTWYFIAGECDGSQTAGLSKLEGSRTRPRMVNQGWFEMPFFLKVQVLPKPQE